MVSNVRRPSVQVRLNGSLLGGIESIDVDSSSHFSADRFRLRLAAKTSNLNSMQDPGSEIEVLISVDGNSWSSLILGRIDTVSLDPVQGEIELDGRDLTASLIEAQTDETFSNRTASEVAAILAARHGLQADVDATTQAIGRFDQTDRDHVSLGQFAKTITEWDLLVRLAITEGFDLYIQGRELSFRRPRSEPASVLRVSDCLSVKLERCLGLARPMAVSVKSWSQSTAQAITANYEVAGQGPLWSRAITRPNLTFDDAAKLARQTISDLKRHEWNGSVVLPGELLLSPRSTIALSGSSSASDRLYRVSQITRRINIHSGFTQHMLLQGVS